MKAEWGKGKFIFGTLLVRIPWKKTEYQGETNLDLDYTLKWIVKEDNEMTHLCIQMFRNIIEEDCEFEKATKEIGTKVIEDVAKSEGPDPDEDLEGEAQSSPNPSLDSPNNPPEGSMPTPSEKQQE